MKVRRFNNLWAMGLILFGAILIAFYVAKIFFPAFVIGIAEIPSIVNIGNYIDSHSWLHHLVNGIISFATMYLFGCACCRIKKLNLVESACLVLLILISYVIERFLPSQLFTYSVCVYFIFVLIIVIGRKVKDYKVLFSTIICYLITAFAQSLSLEIRNISTLITYPNTATFFILIIDGTIWHILLYLYFNYKGEKDNG